MERIIELKHQYQGKMHIRMLSISTDHIGNDDKTEHNVCECGIICGAGTESIAISQNGLIRPCTMLPENMFSISGKHALEEHINGNFHMSEFFENAKKYAAVNNISKAMPYLCRGLISVYKSEVL